MTARLSFLSWNPSPSLWEAWVKLVGDMCHANRRDPNVEILLLVSSGEMVEKLQSALPKPEGQGEGDAISADEIAIKSSSSSSSPQIAVGQQLIRILNLSSGKKLNVAEKLNLLCDSARGTYLKFFTVNPRHKFPHHCYLSARDLRPIFARNMQSSQGSMAHLWQGNLEDELEFASFLFSKMAIAVLGGFAHSFSPQVSRLLQTILALEPLEDVHEIIQLCFLSHQLAVNYAVFLRTFCASELQNNKQSILVCRGVRYNYPAFATLPLNPILLLRPFADKRGGPKPGGTTNETLVDVKVKSTSSTATSTISQLLGLDIKVWKPQNIRTWMKDQVAKFHAQRKELKGDLQEHSREFWTMEGEEGETKVIDHKYTLPPAPKRTSSNIVSLSALTTSLASWWPNKKAERQIEKQALQRLRQEVDIPQEQTDDWEVILGWVLLGLSLAVLVISVTLSALALTKINRLEKLQTQLTKTV